jgi:hypothetical protein
MTLHVPTILVALLMAVGLFAVSLGMAGTYLREHEAMKRWAWGTWTLAGGFALLASRAVLPEGIAILLGNTALAASLYLLGDATHQFIRRRAALAAGAGGRHRAVPGRRAALAARAPHVAALRAVRRAARADRAAGGA